MYTFEPLVSITLRKYYYNNYANNCSHYVNMAARGTRVTMFIMHTYSLMSLLSNSVMLAFPSSVMFFPSVAAVQNHHNIKVI